MIDFDALAASPIQLFVTATNVRTGRGRVFRNAEITPEVLLASACLPTLFQAVEIDGESYWDGGYSGNPTMTPLIRESDALDTILVQINPVERPGTPRTARDILNRLNEVSFNAVLLKELRMMALLRQQGQPGKRRGRALGRDAHPPHHQRRDGRPRLFLEAQCRMGVPDDAPCERAGARPRPSTARTRTISASDRRSTSTS